MLQISIWILINHSAPKNLSQLTKCTKEKDLEGSQEKKEDVDPSD
jgi:hypothetical protein